MRSILANVRLEKKMRRRARKSSSEDMPSDMSSSEVAVPTHPDRVASFENLAECSPAPAEESPTRTPTESVSPSPDVEKEVSEDDSQYDSSRVPDTVLEDIDELARTAHHGAMPHVCLVGPSHLDPSTLSEWSRFCKHAVNIRVVQRLEPSNFCADRLCIMVANRNGRFVIYDEEWTMWILRNKMSRAIYALALLDDSNSLSALDALPEGHSALVYDPLNPDSQDAMISWASNGAKMFVIPLANTPMDASCVVQRSNEMLHTYKL